MPAWREQIDTSDWVTLSAGSRSLGYGASTLRVYRSRLDEGFPEPVAVTPDGTEYWLLHELQQWDQLRKETNENG